MASVLGSTTSTTISRFTAPPHHSHSDPWALQHICCDSPEGHGASSSSSVRAGSSSRSMGPPSFGANTTVSSNPNGVDKIARSGGIPDMDVGPLSAPLLGGYSGGAQGSLAGTAGASRIKKRPRPDGAPGHRRVQSQSQVGVSRVPPPSNPSSPANRRLTQTHTGRDIRSLPTSTHSSPAGAGTFPFSPISPGTAFTSAMNGSSDTAIPCSPEVCCTDTQCDQMEVECCTDPTCVADGEDDRADICNAPHGECTHVSPRMDVGDDRGHSHLFGEGLGEAVDMQRGQEGVEGAVVGADAVSGSGSGTEMDGDGTGNMDGAMEGDELVKWACSDEGCAAIQQYLESCTQPDCSLPALPLPVEPALKPDPVPHHSLAGVAQNTVAQGASSNHQHHGHAHIPTSLEHHHYQSHVNAHTSHHPNHGHGQSDGTSHMPHFHLSQAAPPNLSLDTMDMQHLLMHAQLGSFGLNRQPQLQSQFQAGGGSANDVGTSPDVHSCGNPNCTAHLGLAATNTPNAQSQSQSQSQSPFNQPTPPNQGQGLLLGSSAGNGNSGGNGTMTGGQLSSINPNANPVAQLLREYQRRASLQHQMDGSSNTNAGRSNLSGMQHMQHSRHHTHASPHNARQVPMSAPTAKTHASVSHAGQHTHSHPRGHGYASLLGHSRAPSTSGAGSGSTPMSAATGISYMNWQSQHLQNQNHPQNQQFAKSLSPADSTHPFGSEASPFQLSPASMHSQSQASNELSMQLTKELEMALAASIPGSGMHDSGKGGSGSTVPSPMLPPSATATEGTYSAPRMPLTGSMQNGEMDELFGMMGNPGGECPSLQPHHGSNVKAAGMGPSRPVTASGTPNLPNGTFSMAPSAFLRSQQSGALQSQPHPTHICHWLNCHKAFGSMPDLLAHVAADHLGAGLGTAGEASQAPAINAGQMQDGGGVTSGSASLSGSMQAEGGGGIGNQLDRMFGSSTDNPFSAQGQMQALSNGINGFTHNWTQNTTEAAQQQAFNAETDRLLNCLWDDCNPLPQECSAEEPGMCPPHPIAGAHGHGFGHVDIDGMAMLPPPGSANTASGNAFQGFNPGQFGQSNLNGINQALHLQCNDPTHNHEQQHQQSHSHNHNHNHSHAHAHTNHSTGEPFSPQTMLRHVLEEHLGVPGEILGWDASNLALGLGLGPIANGTPTNGMAHKCGLTPESLLGPPGVQNGHAKQGLSSTKKEAILCGPTITAAHDKLHAPTSDGPAGPDLTCHWPDCLHRAPFPSPAELMDHLSDEHIGRGKDSYVCLWGDCAQLNEGAGRKFRSRQKVLRHLQSHTGHKPFICPECEQAFSEMAPLQAHLRRHKEEKPFVCEHEGCGKRFAIAGSLTIHMRTHNGEKPFVCPHCDKGFVEASNLTKHIRTHTGERPFACPHPGCGKCFPRPDQLKRHAAIHERQKAKELEKGNKRGAVSEASEESSAGSR